MIKPSPYIASLRPLRAVATIRCIEAMPTGRRYRASARWSGSGLLRGSSIRSLNSSICSNMSVKSALSSSSSQISPRYGTRYRRMCDS
ncbi:hypothetical protein ACSHWB_21880 [Lentzea sp. HUAS TT2]|uniref:hypothetical protein n=1 Tax=Lentzea sp. HUAS TT2 TaxID=3447454 RepID=UPI003F71A3B3